MTSNGDADLQKALAEERRRRLELEEREERFISLVKQELANPNPNIHAVLEALRAGLSSIILKSGSADEKSVTNILTPFDEVRYWSELSSLNSGSKDQQERASCFAQLFQGIADFKDLSQKELGEVSDLLEKTQDILDTVWKTTNVKVYPEERMRHLLLLISSTVGRHVQSKVVELQVWTGKFSAVRDTLRKGLQVCEKWSTAVEALTARHWPSFTSHPWKGKKLADEFLETLRKRLQEVLSLRTVYEHTLQLLSAEDARSLKLDRVPGLFDTIESFNCTVQYHATWKAAVSEFEKAMQPAEKKVATALRAQFGQLSGHPHQLLNEFQKYKELVARPGVSRELASEREMLLGQLVSWLSSVKDAMARSDPPHVGKNLPKVVSTIVWLKQLSTKVDNMMTLAHALLADLPRTAEFISQAGQQQQELKVLLRDQFKDWERDVLAALEGGGTTSLSLQATGKLWDFDAAGKLVVNYSDQLVSLFREVRNLTVMGFNVHRKIRAAAEEANKFLHYGVTLKRVANFYNTIHSQMIPSQQGMLLEASKALEAEIFQSVKGGRGQADQQLTWNRTDEVEAYIERLQRKAERLTSENRKLRKFHFQLADRVVQLMGVDLLRQEGKWQEGVKELARVMEVVERQGYKDLRAWRIHWDYQLYKALEFQYRWGLEGLSENLPELNVELLYKNQALQFRPPFEQLRANYYRAIKKFIRFPMTFTGVGNTDIFKYIPDRNPESLTTVYKKAEQLFQRLVHEKEQFEPWVALGSVQDLDGFVYAHLVEAADWEYNFKMLKERGKEVEKLPLSKKIDCIHISFAPVKATIDGFMQQLADALVASLRKSVAGHKAELEEFLKGAMEVLTRRPASVDEIGQSNIDYKKLLESKPGLKTVMDKCEAKNKLLRSVVGAAGAVNLTQLRSQWENFEHLMEHHDRLIKDQLDSLKAEIEARIITFNAALAKFATRWNEIKPKKVAIHEREAAQLTLKTMKDIRAEYEELKGPVRLIIADCQHFDMPPPKFPLLESLDDEIAKAEEGWRLYEEFNAQLDKLACEEWSSFRTKVYLFEDFVSFWADSLEKAGRPAGAAAAPAAAASGTRDPVVVYLRNEVEVYRKVLPVFKYLKGDVLSEEHWQPLFRMLNVPREVTLSTLTFGHFLRAHQQLAARVDEIKELHARAQGEATIRQALRELALWAADTEFAFTEYSNNGRTTPLIKEWKDLLTQVGDNQALLQSLKDTPYFASFADEAGLWEGKLALLDECLHLLNVIQRKWVYLEPIFARGALTHEQPRFKRVDDEYRGIMNVVGRERKVMSLVAIGGVRDSLAVLSDQLERCQKALSEFLEEKRAAFPRFYFLGDDDLLEILGQAQNPAVIQSHLKKLFQGIHSVVFNDQCKLIVAMRSLQGEEVRLATPVEVTERVEAWLARLADEMKVTLHAMLLKCLDVNNISTFPSQILCLAEQIHFTSRCERAIVEGKLDKLNDALREQLTQYTTFDAGNDTVLKLKLKALVFDLIHHIDVVKELKRQQCRSVDSWAWKKQLRFYLVSTGDKKDKKCVVRMSDAQFDYTYEYQGNAPRLVHTPLTDKCYLTLMYGMHIGNGGNPYGPAGTGKTESVKALGQALGRQVLVFNCDEGIDVKSMGRIFTGLVKCGAWGCFDEFNRLDEEVLSAVSQQIQVIQAALKERRPVLELLKKTVEVDFNSGIFVTLNPAGKGYGGRSKLPDNLKQLFRSVAMSVPDNELIAEVILFSEGFQQGSELGRKLVSVFTMCGQLLSSQQHYDWGLRALKTVLSAAGQLLQQQLKERHVQALPKEEEAAIVVKALRANTLSKLTFADATKFTALVGDVFTGVEPADIAYPELEGAIKAVLAEMKFEPLPRQIRKTLQFYEALKQRMGVVIVGPSGSGKSTLWRVLRAALQKLGRVIPQHTMNPKAMPRHQLLGYLDTDTREWFDGVLTAAARQVVKEPPEHHSWIICDGDIDPEWIESLNSVLDDNRLLTLPNGERIQFGPNVNFIFETTDLKAASPATVSRMGMIFLSEEDMDMKAVLKAWLRTQPEGTQTRLEAWADDMVLKALDAVAKAAKDLPIDTSRLGLLRNGLAHLAGAETKTEFALGLARGLGAVLSTAQRAPFVRDVLSWGSANPPDKQRPLECYYDKRADALKGYVPPAPATALTREALQREPPPLIPTVDTQMYGDILQPWINGHEPFLVVGPEGAGKELLLTHLFTSLRSTHVAVLHCNAQTKAEHLVQKLLQTCKMFSTNTGRVLRPKDGERLIVYLKDINLPKPDKYGTVQLCAFVQQLLTYHGFYDESLEWVGLERILFVASMNSVQGLGRHPLSQRFAAGLRVCSLHEPEKERLTAVYTTYLEAALANCQHPLTRSPAGLKKLADGMLSVYEQTKRQISPDEHPLFVISPRDLTRWVRGLLQYNLEANELLAVWAYEAQRLFKDRLPNDTAARWDANVLAQTLKASFNYVLASQGSYYTSFGTPLPPAATPARGGRLLGKSLMFITAEDLSHTVAQRLVQYEREVKQLKLLLFPEVLDHIALLDRVLSRPGGSALLVGRAGVGRRSATLLVAHMHGMEVRSPSMGRGYGLKPFRSELKNAMVEAGVQGKPLVWLVEAHQLVEPAFLELLNSLLSSGEVPGLFGAEELDSLLAPLRDLLSEEGFFGSVYEFFVSRVRAHLHVVLSMDPTHPDFGVWCQSNPALTSQCAVLWWEGWSRGSLGYVARTMLDDLLKELPQAQRDSLLELVLRVHEVCAAEHAATPRQFVALLENYCRVFASKRAVHVEQHAHLRAGLVKLTEAKRLVDELSADAAQKRVQLDEKQAQAEAALAQITKALEGATDQRKEMADIEAKLQHESRILEERSKAVEAKLALSKPMVAEALAQVSKLQNKQLAEIQAFNNPPKPVLHVLEAVLLMLGIQDTSWLNMKRFLNSKGAGGRTAKDMILNFDARSLLPATRKEVEKLLADESKAPSFLPEVIGKASQAAAPLALWVKANVQYAKVLESVAPLEQELAEIEKGMSGAKERKSKLQDDLQKLEVTVSKLKEEFAQRTAEAEQLRLSLQQVTQTLEAAEHLLGKLVRERDRWDEQAKNLEKALLALPALSVFASGYITYIGPHPEETRSDLLQKWIAAASSLAANSTPAVSKGSTKPSAGLILPESFNLLDFMTTESEQLIWKGEGLPSDQLSVENAIVILQSSRTPYIIDPATQATEWLKKHLVSSGSNDSSGSGEEGHSKRVVEVIAQQDPKFVNTLELAVRFGKTLIVLEADTIEPILFPLLRKDILGQGPRYQVQLGEKVVEYNEGFTLFLVTRNPSPELLPEVVSHIAQVSFTVTRSGLEAQLLAQTLQHEKPELESRKSALLLEEERQKVQMAVLEKQLLQELAASQGNILQNKALIDSLNDTKAKSEHIAEALEKARKIQQSLDKEREVYRPVAKKGSTLLFLIRDLENANHVYQYSLSAFVRLFAQALEVADAAPPANASTAQSTATDFRIGQITTNLLHLVFQYVCRSLFKADRLMFGLNFVRLMFPDSIRPVEWDVFVGNNAAAASGKSAASTSKLPPWANKDRATAFQTLFNSLPDVVAGLELDDTEVWGAWAKSATPEHEFPARVSKKLQPFQRLLMVQALRPDRLESAMTAFVCEMLGLRSLAPPPLNLGKLLEETLATEPVMFVVTPGADPSQELEEFAYRTIGRERYFQVAMGQGQSEEAQALLHRAARDGYWLCLKNLHLAVSWLPTLEKELNALQPHPDFRLWLTTEPHLKLPAILLRSAKKLTYEAPPGLKNNLMRTYETWPQQYVESGPPVRAQALFVLAWLHALLQERRSYVPQGWTKFYEFSMADLRAAAEAIDALCKSNSPAGIDWAAIQGLLVQSIYGGRVDNPYDLRVLLSYVEEYFSPEMFSKQGGARLAKGVALPASSSYKAFMEVIAALPDANDPVLFGLPANIDRTLQQINGNAVLSQLKLLQFPARESAKFNKEQWTQQLAGLMAHWQAITSSSGVLKSATRAPANKKAAEYPVLSFLVLESKKAHGLVGTVQSHLTKLLKLLRGEILLTPELLDVGSSLVRGTVPVVWQDMWEGPDNPYNYMQAVVSRSVALASWVEKAEVDSAALLSSPLNLSELFRPEGFLNALRQQTARALKLPMDSLKLAAAHEPKLLPRAVSPIMVTGLLLQGASFNGDRLADAHPETPSLVSLPTWTLAWVPKDEKDPYPAQCSVEVPLYYTPARSKVVTQLLFPCGERERAKWNVCSVAIFLADWS